jgi:hypothetical protein
MKSAATTPSTTIRQDVCDGCHLPIRKLKQVTPLGGGGRHAIFDDAEQLSAANLARSLSTTAKHPSKGFLRSVEGDISTLRRSDISALRLHAHPTEGCYQT